MMLLFTLAVLIFMVSPVTITTASPLWQSDSNFRAGTSTLIWSAVTAPYDQTFPVYFTSPMLSTPPCIAIGYQSYEGTDLVIQEWITCCSSFFRYWLIVPTKMDLGRELFSLLVLNRIYLEYPISLLK